MRNRNAALEQVQLDHTMTGTAGKSDCEAETATELRHGRGSGGAMRGAHMRAAAAGGCMRGSRVSRDL